MHASQASTDSRGICSAKSTRGSFPAHVACVTNATCRLNRSLHPPLVA